jgi:hypothetical protein
LTGRIAPELKVTPDCEVTPPPPPPPPTQPPPPPPPATTKTSALAWLVGVSHPPSADRYVRLNWKTLFVEVVDVLTIAVSTKFDEA